MNNYIVRVRVAFETQRIQGSERDWLVASGSSRGRRWITFTRSDSFITPVAAIRVPFIDPAHYSSVCRALESATIRFTIWILLSLSE